ncbi:hypothetical protein HB13667_11575 [Pseudomonas putida]|uniref:Uncharacterized protein n=1 Tax=Pseudomonas putida TaxID=303 RepID=A0A0P7DAV6_PSEPU|nr:hypothetical protein [Pseudomonas putida]KPM65552.1 hypothetical protein HB13667_11575 [Pseudomonas putida]
MITLTGTNGNKHYLAPAAIAVVTEASASSQWHGIRAIVRTFDGQVLEVREQASDIAHSIRVAQG